MDSMYSRIVQTKNDTLAIAVETGNQVRNILFSDNESLIYTTDAEIKQINIKTKKHALFIIIKSEWT